MVFPISSPRLGHFPVYQHPKHNNFDPKPNLSNTYKEMPDVLHCSLCRSKGHKHRNQENPHLKITRKSTLKGNQRDYQKKVRVTPELLFSWGWLRDNLFPGLRQKSFCRVGGRSDSHYGSEPDCQCVYKVSLIRHYRPLLVARAK